MRNVTLELTILLGLVASINTSWQTTICEDEYSTDWCLGSAPCMEGFLDCNCVPLAVVVEKRGFPDTLSLCMMAYVWGVSEPVCCKTGKKRSKTPRLLDDDISTDDTLLSVIRDIVQKRDFGKNYEEILNNDSKSKSTSKRKNRPIDTIGEYPLSKFSGSGTSDSNILVNSLKKLTITRSDTNPYSLRQQVLGSSINTGLNSEDMSKSGSNANNANLHSKHKHRVTKTKSLPKQKSMVKGPDNVYRNSVKRSSVKSSGETYPRSLQKSSAIVNKNVDPQHSVPEISKADALIGNTFRSKLLHVLKCYTDRH